jgi:hypothetical protein
MAPRPNWSRPLPRALSLLDDGKEFLRLTTLGDVRDFLKRIPKERLQFDTWQAVSRRLDTASAGGSIDDLSTALQMLLMLEGVESRLK